MSTYFKDSNRKQRLPSNWYSLRSKVLRRDNYGCKWLDEYGKECKSKATDVDHILRGDNNSLDNLQSLCTYHHRYKTAKEGNLAKNLKERELKAKYLRPKEERFF